MKTDCLYAMKQEGTKRLLFTLAPTAAESMRDFAVEKLNYYRQQSP